MRTPLCEASGPMLAQQYCSCMAAVYNDACSQTCQRPLAVTGETLLRLIRRRRVFSCGAKTAASQGVTSLNCCSKTRSERKEQVKVLLRTGTRGVLSCGEGMQQSKLLLKTGARSVLSCGEGRQQFKVLLRTGTGGVLSCGEGKQQIKVLMRTCLLYTSPSPRDRG